MFTIANNKRKDVFFRRAFEAAVVAASTCKRLRQRDYDELEANLSCIMALSHEPHTPQDKLNTQRKIVP